MLFIECHLLKRTILEFMIYNIDLKWKCLYKLILATVYTNNEHMTTVIPMFLNFANI